MHVCKHHRIILTKSSRHIFRQYLPFQSLSSNTRVGCERCSRVIEKTLARRGSIVVVHFLSLNRLYTFFECFYGRFSKSSKCPLWYWQYFNVDNLAIHNAANHAIAKNSCQSYCKEFEVLFSKKQQGAIRTNYLAFSITLA